MDVLSLDADIFYSFVVNGEVTFPCACIIMQSARSLGHFLFLLEALYCHIVSLCSVLYKSLTGDSIKVEMYKATCYCGYQAIQSQDCMSTKSENTYTL